MGVVNSYFPCLHIFIWEKIRERGGGREKTEDREEKGMEEEKIQSSEILEIVRPSLVCQAS